MENAKFQEVPGRTAVRLIGSHTRTFTAVALASVILAGCSSVPDALNPVEWYKGVVNVFSGDDNEAETAGNESKPANGLVADRNTPPPGSDQKIPSIASVPERPQTSTVAQRQAEMQGLVADRDSGRRYSTEVIPRQAPAESQLGAPPPAQVATPPAPAPNAPVAIRPGQTPAPTQQTARAPALAPSAPPPPVRMTPPQPGNAAPSARPQTAMSGPRPPALAPVPPPVFGPDQGIVVVSGEGVQTVASLQPTSFGPSQSSMAAPPPGAVASGIGAHSLSEFNPTMARGSYQVANILFANGSAALGARERQILSEVVKQHRQVGGTIRVIGHASSRTRTLGLIQHKMANFQISAARADVVAKQLIRLGVQPASLFVGAVSDHEPVYRESMPSGEAGNRRTEIFIDY